MLDIVDGVEHIETHHTRPVSHEETKRGVSFRGRTLPYQVGEREGAPGGHVKHDKVGDFIFEAENVAERMLVFSPL